MAASSSAVSSKSKTSKFSAIRCGLVDFGIAERPLLQVPAQHDLGRGLVVGLGDVGDGGVLEGAGVAALAVEGDAADGGPGLGEDAVLGVGGTDLGLREVRVHLDLVDRGHDAGVLQQLVEVVGHEVGDADGPHAAVLEQLLEGAVGLDRQVEAARQRLVEDEQVDLVDPELAGALVEGVQGGVVAVVADPDLSLDEDIRSCQAGAADGLADLALVGIGGSGVDVAVPRAQRGLDGVDRLLGRGLEDAEAECGHLDAVVQGHARGHAFTVGIRRRSGEGRRPRTERTARIAAADRDRPADPAVPGSAVGELVVGGVVADRHAGGGCRVGAGVGAAG